MMKYQICHFIYFFPGPNTLLHARLQPVRKTLLIKAIKVQPYYN